LTESVNVIPHFPELLFGVGWVVFNDEICVGQKRPTHKLMRLSK